MPGLSFLSPWFLAGVAAVGLPILLHLFARQTAKEVRFPATRFVPASAVEYARRRRVTDVLLLLLRCAALMLLAFAFARPYFADVAAGSDAPATLVALDTSFSMAGADTWRAAQAEALKTIDGAPAGGPVAVLAFDDGGRVVFPISADRSAARRVVEQMRPGAGGTALTAAVPAALDLLDGRPGTLVIVTDRQRSGLSGAVRVPGNVQVRFAGVPAARENLAVSDIRREGAALEATVVNGGLADRETELSLRVDGESIARRPQLIAGGAAVVVRFDRVGRERGVATVVVSDVQGLPADDERTLILDPPAGIRALSIVDVSGTHSSGFYVRRALESSPREQPVQVGDLPLPAARLPEFGPADRPDVYVLLATRGLGREARQQLAAAVESGAGLLIAVGPGVEAGAVTGLFPRGPALRIEEVGRATAPLAIAPVDVRHAVFAAYADRAGVLSRVRFEQVVRIPGDTPARVLARFDNGLPALTEYAAGKGRVLMLASDLDTHWNDWPLSPTFLPFLREAVGHLAQRPPEPQEYLVGQVPAAIDARPGAHVLRDGRRVAVNVDSRESSLDLAEVAELDALVTVEPARTSPSTARAGASHEARQSIWRYLLFGAVAALVGESLISARRAVRN